MRLRLALAVVLVWNGVAHGAEIVGSDLVEKAKAEGEVVWYSTLPLPETQAWAALFTKKYGIKVSLFRAGATAMTQKLQTEIPAGRWGFDVVMNRAERVFNRERMEVKDLAEETPFFGRWRGEVYPEGDVRRRLQPRRIDVRGVFDAAVPTDVDTDHVVHPSGC